jgi:hypothetical protein
MKRHSVSWPAVAAALWAACASAAAQTSWRFLMLGDSRGDDNGVNAAILSELAAQIVVEQPALVLFAGDLVEGSEETDVLIAQLTAWRQILQPVYDAGIRVLAVRGNHEDAGSVTAWNSVFVDTYAMPGNGPAGEVNVTYSWAQNNAFFVGVDQYSGHPHRVDQLWLDGQLAANTRPHVFVFGHEPAFRAGHEECQDNYPADRDVLWASVAAAGGQTYLCGHDHFFDHARIDDGDGDPNNDLHQYIVGTAGAPLTDFDGVYGGLNSGMTPVEQYYVSTYGYLVVDIDRLHVTITWKQRISAGVYAAADVWSYAARPAPYAGDLNCDGVISYADINPFVAVLGDSAAWQAANPGCPIANGDINDDGVLSYADINPFVILLRDS